MKTISRKNKWINKALLAATGICLVIGILAPMITFEQFWIFKDKYSLLMGTINLLTSGEYFLFLVIFCFSIFLPIMKIFFLYRVHLSDLPDSKQQKRLKLLSFSGKWSMLDVFVVALLVMLIKIGGMGSVQIHLGLYSFTLAVILSMITTHRMHRMARGK